MGVTFKTILDNLNLGLEDIERKIKNAKDYKEVVRLKQEREIQQTKIDYLKKGYNFKERELKPQTKFS